MDEKWLIDAHVLSIEIDGCSFESGYDYEKVLEIIAEAPTVDAVEVVHARWIVKGQDIFCSNCNSESGYNAWGASSFSAYCPHCGAKMDLEEKQ